MSFIFTYKCRLENYLSKSFTQSEERFNLPPILPFFEKSRGYRRFPTIFLRKHFCFPPKKKCQISKKFPGGYAPGPSCFLIGMKFLFQSSNMIRRLKPMRCKNGNEIILASVHFWEWTLMARKYHAIEDLKIAYLPQDLEPFLLSMFNKKYPFWQLKMRKKFWGLRPPPEFYRIFNYKSSSVFLYHL